MYPPAELGGRVALLGAGGKPPPEAPKERFHDIPLVGVLEEGFPFVAPLPLAGRAADVDESLRTGGISEYGEGPAEDTLRPKLY